MKIMLLVEFHKEVCVVRCYFLLYIHDLPKILKHAHTSLYADDTVIYLSNADATTECNLLQHDLNLLKSWCDMNKMTINCKKTKYCIYGMRSLVKKSKNQNLILSLGTNILEKVCSYKYLGFTLDEHLNFNKHVNDLKQLVSHKLYLLATITLYISMEACINIFKTMILSLNDYGDIVYNGISQLNLDNVEKLFYRDLHICVITNNYMSKEDLRYACNIASLKSRHDCHQLLFMHKQKANVDLMKPKTVNTRLHDAPVFNTYKPNNEKAKCNVLYKGATKWDGLPSNARNLDFTDFKTLQKKGIKN